MIKLSFTRQELDAVLKDPAYQPEKLLSFLARDLGDIYTSDAGLWEKYTIGEHTLMVLRQFEKYYSYQILPAQIDRNFFRFFISLHDIGKKKAIELGNKDLQHEHTTALAGDIFQQLNFSDQEWHLFESLVEREYLGHYFKGRDIKATCQEIISACKKTDLSLLDFLAVLEMFYKVDAGSYTKDASGLESLDKLFFFDHVNHRLNFSKEVEEKFIILRDALIYRQ
ncbi:MAG: hypothetical protein NT165_00955 [Candidatus Falkowbacteria bacterium]|nr:hypothetical protein [Candidatus Falkowbacteria bacterium]